MGTRTLILRQVNGIAKTFLAGSDRQLLESATTVRLMGLFNFKPSKFSDGELSGEYLGEEVKEGEHAPIIQWLPAGENVKVVVVMPDSTRRSGFGEKGLASEKVGSIVQFVRFGFGRIDQAAPEHMTLYFAHQ
jgi:glutamyl-tRNA synthetase